MLTSVKEYLRLSASEIVVALGGAAAAILGFVQRYLPSWGWFSVALVAVVWVQFRAFDRVRRQRDAALRDPREIAEIRAFLLIAKQNGERLLAGLYGDRGAFYSSHAKGHIALGTRSLHVAQWRADVRGSIRGYLPGRVAEFDDLAELPPEEEYGDPNRLNNAQEFTTLTGRLVLEVRWLDHLYLLTGLSLGARKSRRQDP